MKSENTPPLRTPSRRAFTSNWPRFGKFCLQSANKVGPVTWDKAAAKAPVNS